MSRQVYRPGGYTAAKGTNSYNRNNYQNLPQNLATAAETGMTGAALLQMGKAGLARLAGGAGLGKVAAAVGGAGAGALAGKAALAAGAAHVAAGSIGGTMNGISRMMNGENPIQAMGNAAFDTADYLTLGATSGLSNSAQKMLGLEGSDNRAEKLNEAKSKVEAAKAAGDYGAAAIAEQELQKLVEQTGVEAPGQSAEELYNERVRLGLEQRRLGDEQTFDMYKRVAGFDSELLNQNAEKALDRNWYADNWKSNNRMNENASQSINNMMTNSLQNISQAAMMKW